MLSKQRQVFLIRKWLDKISVRLVYFMATGEQEEIHRMRVETKKIKALISLSEQCIGKPESKISLHFLNEIYKVAGKIREAFLNIELSKNTGGQELFIEEQKKISAGQFRKLEQLIPIFQMTLEKNKKRLAERMMNVKQKDVVEIFQRFLSEVALSLRKIEQEELLHEARKKIKFLQYNFRVMPQSIQKELPIDTVYLNTIQDTIGNWHDSIVYLKLLQQFSGIEKRNIDRQKEKIRSQASVVYELGKNFEMKAIQNKYQRYPLGKV